MIKNKVIIIGLQLIAAVFSTICNQPEVLDFENQVCLPNKEACVGRYFIYSENKCQNTCGLEYSVSLIDGINYCQLQTQTCDLSATIMRIDYEGFVCLQPVDIAQCVGFLVQDTNGLKICLPFCPTGFTQGTGANSNICASTDTSFSWVNHPFTDCSTGIRDIQSLTCLTSKDQCTKYYIGGNRICVPSCPPNQNFLQGQGYKYCINNYNLYNYQFYIPNCVSPQIYDLESNSCLASESSCSFILVSDTSGGKVCWPQCPINIGFIESIDTNTNKKICTAPSGFSSLAQQPFFNCPNSYFRDATTFGCLTLKYLCKYTLNYEINMCVFSCPKNLQKFLDSYNNYVYCQKDSLPNCTSTVRYDVINHACQVIDYCSGHVLQDAFNNQICWSFCPKNIGYTLSVSSTGVKLCTAPTEVNLLKLPFFNCSAPMIRDVATLGCIQPSQCQFRIVHELQACYIQCPNNYIEAADSNGVRICKQIDFYAKSHIQLCGPGYIFNLATKKCDLESVGCSNILVKDAFGNKLCWPFCFTSQGYTSSTDSAGKSICTAPAGKNIANEPFFKCVPNKIRDQATLGCLSDESQCTNKLIGGEFICVINCPPNFNVSSDGKYCLESGYQPTTVRCANQNFFIDVNKNFCQLNEVDCQDYLIKDEFGGRICYPFCLTALGFTESSNSAGQKFCTPPSNISIYNYSFFECLNPHVRDLSNLGCLDSKINCNKKMIYDWWTCFTQCPPNYSYESIDSTNNITICSSTPPASGGTTTGSGGTSTGGSGGTATTTTSSSDSLPKCSSSQFIHYQKNSCISSDNECQDYIIKDQSGFKLCWPNCPQGYAISNVNGYKFCNPPTTVSVYNATIFNCNSPKVLDIPSLNCLNDISYCTGILIESKNHCVSICPDGYRYALDYNNRPVCWLSNFTCSNDTVKNSLLNQCINIKDCKEYVFTDSKGEKLCIPQCPDQFTAGMDSTNTYKTCIPSATIILNSLAISNCNNPLIKDYKSAGCLNQPSQCVGFLAKQFNCISSCPVGYQQGKDKNNLPTCYLPTQYNLNCNSTSFFNYQLNRCSDNDMDCKENLIIDGKGMKVCWPNCPTGFFQSLGSGINYCKTNAVDWYLPSQSFFSCAAPKVGDVSTLSCLSDISKCVSPKVFITDRNHCSDKCPLGYTTVQDQVTQVIYCNKNEVENLCYYGSVKRIIDGYCIDPFNCKEFLMQDSPFAYCIPECPANFIQGYDKNLNVNTCSPPINTVLSQYPIKNCKGVRDYPTAGCLTNSSQCKGIYISESNICISQCPIDFYESKDSVGNRICIQKEPFELVLCSSPQVIDILNNVCISASACTGQLITDSTGKQICHPLCPSTWASKDASGNAICTVPATFTYANTYFASCKYGVYNVDDFNCIDQSACKGYLLKRYRMCLPECPSNLVKIIDPKTGTKYCMLKEKDGSANCDEPFIQNQIDGSCIYPEFCKFTLIEGPQLRMCIPQCPSIFIKGFDIDLNVQSCLLPTGKTLASFSFGNCTSPNYRDYVNGNCLTQANTCPGFIIESRKICVSICPPNWEVVKNSSTIINSCIPPIICQPSQILDTVSKVCLDDIKQCKGVINKQKFTCDGSCPSLFAPYLDSSINVKWCIPCFYIDNFGNCYEKCPYPMLSVASTVPNQTGTCVKDTDQCQGYFTFTLGTCEAACRFGFIPDDSSSPKSCIPCSATNSCSSQNLSTCNQKLSSDKIRCDANCPFGEIALPQVTGQTFQQCQKCPSTQPIISIDGSSCKSQCETAYVLDAKQMKCIDPASCSGVIYTDLKLVRQCLPNCPQGENVVKDADSGWNVCKACENDTFFDPIKQTCQQACNLKDSTGSFCLLSINDCNGSISVDNTQCLKGCPTGQFHKPLSRLNQYQCVTACNSNELVYKNFCFLNCPTGMYNDFENKTCSSTKLACKGALSIDGQSCLPACPSRQYPVASGNTKKCNVCSKKLSTDGVSCGDECGANEFYDLDLLQCVKSNGCDGKILQPDGKGCSNGCKLGQILNYEGTKQACLNNISDCKQNISSDLTSCKSTCEAGEAQISDGKNTKCVYCKLGVSSDGKSCRTSCLDTQLFDVDNKACVSSCGQNQRVSANGKNCVSSCVYPDLKRSSDSTKCFSTCGANELIDKALGCISAAVCKQNNKYISSNNLSCLEKCSHFSEFEDPSNANYCKACDDKSFARHDDNGKVVCQRKSNDKASDLNQESDSLKSEFDNIPAISPELKDETKSKVQNISSQTESTMKETKQDQSLSNEDKKKSLIKLVNDLKDLADKFLSKLEKLSHNEDEDANKLVLGTDEFQLVAENKKDGFIFVVSFNSDDFYDANPKLQIEASSVDISQSSTKVDGSLSSLSVTNEAQNPHCSNAAKCGSSGLISVDSNKGNKKRMLQSTSTTSQFTMTYSVEASKIDKTICVSYDPETSAMSPSLNTIADKTKNKITCTFTQNTSLYYDSDCSIVNSSLCPQNTPVTTTITPNQTDPSLGQKLLISFIMMIAYFLI